MIKSWCW